MWITAHSLQLLHPMVNMSSILSAFTIFTGLRPYASDRVYIGSGNSPFFYCLDLNTAEIYWIYKLGNRIKESTLCIYRDKIYLLAADGYVHAIE